MDHIKERIYWSIRNSFSACRESSTISRRPSEMSRTGNEKKGETINLQKETCAQFFYLSGDLVSACVFSLLDFI